MNLLNIKVGDYKFYKKITYPAGEIQVRLRPERIEEVKEAHVIVVSTKGVFDLMEVLQLGSAIVGIGRQAILSMPYLPYGRADRRFVEGDCEGLETFQGTLLSGLFGGFYTLDVHSNKVPWRSLINISPLPFIEKAIEDFSGAKFGEVRDLTVLFPDEGASKRYDLSNFIGSNVGGVNLKKAYCHKKRDPATGALSGFEVPKIETSKALIVDDICDGGGTFLGIAKEIDGLIDLGLYVTHGIFSKGLAPIFNEFGKVYTTNSLNQKRSIGLILFDAESHMEKKIKEWYGF